MDDRDMLAYEAEGIEDAFEDDIFYEPVEREGANEEYLDDYSGGGYVFGGTARKQKRKARGFEKSPQHVDKLSPHELGKAGEDMAVRLLVELGYTILERNWTCSCGEADIICEDEGTYVLVEVKTRLETTNKGTVPELAVTADKRKRYRWIAECFMSAYGVDTVRFDVVAIGMRPGKSPIIRHFKSAFDGEE